MSRPRIKQKAKTLGAAELAKMSEAELQAAYDVLTGEWMDRSNRGVRNTWRQFDAMDVYYLELQRRRYGPGAVQEAKAELSNVLRMAVDPPERGKTK